MFWVKIASPAYQGKGSYKLLLQFLRHTEISVSILTFENPEMIFDKHSSSLKIIWWYEML